MITHHLYAASNQITLWKTQQVLHNTTEYIKSLRSEELRIAITAQVVF
jgi:hypothetical protein